MQTHWFEKNIQTMDPHTLRFEILKVVNATTTVFLNVTNTLQS